MMKLNIAAFVFIISFQCSLSQNLTESDSLRSAEPDTIHDEYLPLLMVFSEDSVFLSISDSEPSTYNIVSDSEKNEPNIPHFRVGTASGIVLFWGDGSDDIGFPVLKYFNRFERKFSIDIFTEYVFSKHFSLQMMMLKGQSSGDRFFWSNNVPANFRFETSFIQYTIIGLFYPFFSSPVLSEKISPFVFAGTGINAFRSVKYHLTSDSILNLVGYENEFLVKDISEKTLIIPSGFGVDYDVKKNLIIRFSNSFVYMFTDKFDAHEGLGTTINDMYTYTTAGIVYSF
jgi:hypothetical protein